MEGGGGRVRPGSQALLAPPGPRVRLWLGLGVGAGAARWLTPPPTPPQFCTVEGFVTGWLLTQLRTQDEEQVRYGAGRV